MKRVLANYFRQVNAKMQEKLRDVAGCFCIFIKIFREVKDVRSEAHLLLILAAF